jgi:hypothetical protein
LNFTSLENNILALKWSFVSVLTDHNTVCCDTENSLAIAVGEFAVLELDN